MKSYFIKSIDELNNILEQGNFRIASVWENDGTLTTSDNEYINPHGDVIRKMDNYRWAYRWEVAAKFTPREQFTAQTNKNGYTLLNICGATNLMHRVIATTFIDKPNGKNDVNHKDGNKTHNDITNLEWVTKSENMKHYYKYLKGDK